MKALSEKDIRKLAQEAVKQLGKTATPEVIQEVVNQAMIRIDSQQPAVDQSQDVSITRPPRKAGNRVIVTASCQSRRFRLGNKKDG